LIDLIVLMGPHGMDSPISSPSLVGSNPGKRVVFWIDIHIASFLYLVIACKYTLIRGLLRLC
jgi:hypothetical protein